MTVVDEPTVAPGDDVDEPVVPITSGALAADDAGRFAGGEGPPAGPDDTDDDGDAPLPLGAQLRPTLAAGLSTAAAGLVVGGIFASWAARGLGVVAAAIGAGLALLAARSTRPTVVHAATPVVLLGVSLLTLVTVPGGPGELPTLVGDAIDAGRLIRPPVPFDPGWRVLIICVIGGIGFGAASLALSTGRPKLGIVVPLPLVGLASVTQPDSEQFVAGISAFLPVLAAIGVLYGDSGDGTAELDGSFELRRLVRGAVAAVPIIGIFVLFNSASFLFPEPVYDPDDKPQKPRAAPLSAADDRVLFEVASGSPFTGPWRIGILDVYEDDSWLIPGFDRDRLEDIPDDGVISSIRSGSTQQQVTITVRDLGNSAVLPILPGTTQVESGTRVVVDPRTDTVRVPSGRVPAGLTYTLRVPEYPSEAQLATVEDTREATLSSEELAERLEMPEAPDAVLDLLARAPSNPWRRLDFVREQLLDVVTAKGAGAPVAVPPDKVVDLLEGSQTGTPFEIVAAEAMLARWAGVPSRVAFGFDGLNLEDELETVRPRNAAQWLEVHFEGFGWVPLIGAPAQAEASLDTDPNARFDPTIAPSSDVAVELYLPFETEDLTQLYERVRDVLLRFLPLVVTVVVVWLGWPVAAKAQRRTRRRRWAARHGPRTQIAVEYAELRDVAIDLGVGDKYDSPLEYLSKVRDDKEHAELAWLVARTLYGDLRTEVSDADVIAAEELSTSLRRRLSAGQPLQIRMLGWLSRASLTDPYSSEVPNHFHLPIPGLAAARRLLRRLPRPRRGRQAALPHLLGDPR